ncbi:glycosyltransferase [Sphingorhabdus sp. IMCC26285]|uniref:Glycosyltransferase n=1 Tax=Sphingorhabdus profundilacus TaxID=2509718 RepID=A0A6I4M2I8_9SPHN|nr:glycosyltransferase family 4 protein [Sphingorhabdus profundilacus]MVZ98250.1 glycosyltransferase [Sphingorhabdus profundilacus]
MNTEPITIAYPMAGDSLGGSHHSLRGLLEGLDPAMFRPVIILENPTGRLAEHFAAFEHRADPAPPQESFAVGRDFSLSNFASTFAGMGCRAALLREIGAKIVHSNDGRTHATWAFAAKRAGCKLLWHHRADPYAKGLRYLAPWVADQVVAVSRFSLSGMRRGKVSDGAQVVFSPFDVDVQADRHAMRQKLLTELNARPDTIVCGYFGSFIDRKRPLEFINAVAEMRKLQDRPVVGLMFGETTYPELEAAMRARMTDPDVAGSAHIMGYRSPGVDWIAAVDLLLVTAVSEPLGRTLVEAMLVETPVIATDSGGNPEAILDGLGKLVAPDDALAMATSALATLSDKEATSAMTARAKQSAKARFSEATHVAKISEIYRDLSA